MLGMNITFWIVVGVCLLVLLFLIIALKHSHTKRIHLQSYIVYLLLEDTIRQDHKNKFITYIKELDESNIENIELLASNAIEVMSDGLAEEGNSLLASKAMLLNINRG